MLEMTWKFVSDLVVAPGRAADHEQRITRV